MKMNLAVRMKNAYFWMTFIPALVSFIYTVLSLFDIVPTISESMIVQLLSALVTALSTMGVLIDPTTEGVFDSARALLYKKPGQLPDEIENPEAIGTDDGM